MVLKRDNGSPFVAGVTRALLAQWQVIPLYSPPGRPQYNGAIEAGIGALKARTHYQAVRQGQPGEWTLADAEAARQQANTLGRPWGAHGPAPAERLGESAYRDEPGAAGLRGERRVPARRGGRVTPRAGERRAGRRVRRGIRARATDRCGRGQCGGSSDSGRGGCLE